MFTRTNFAIFATVGFITLAPVVASAQSSLASGVFSWPTGLDQMTTTKKDHSKRYGVSIVPDFFAPKRNDKKKDKK
ncbi:MAG: hypothetical protein AAF217_00345 [Pseudomonadota bacterium]